MRNVYVQSFITNKWLELKADSSLKYKDIADQFCHWHGVSCPGLKIYWGSKEIRDGEEITPETSDVFLQTSVSLYGGKGGFGSMLRAIGAQIEKTTNRDACRDLSGRRLRDINEEKRLKNWVEKQAEREREAEERKRKKLEKLKLEHKHEFSDPDYDRVRAEVTEKVHDAVVHAMQATSSCEPSTSKKRRVDDVPLKKTALWTGVSDEDLDSDDSDLDSEGETLQKKDEMVTDGTAAENGEQAAEVAQEPITNNRAENDANVEKDSKVAVMNETEKITEKTEAVENETKSTELKKETVDFSKEPPIVLEEYDSAETLESLGLERLKYELTKRGLKCGGTLKERAVRLFSVKNLKADEIDPSLLSKPPKKTKK